MPLEYVVRWSGARIGSGATVLHFRPVGGSAGAAAVAAATRNFFNAIKTSFPPTVTLRFDPEARLLNVDGTLEAVYNFTAPADVVGGGSAGFANGTGGIIRLNSAAIINGRRLQGRIFLVPMVSSSFASGETTPTVRGTVDAAFATYMTDLNSAGPGLVIWSRTGAAFSDVTTGQLLARPTSLRTRNDRD